MRKIILFLLGYFTIMPFVFCQEAIQKDVANKVFLAFQKEDFSIFNQLFFNSKDYKEILEDYSKNNIVDEIKMKNFTSPINKYDHQSKKRTKRIFKNILRAGKKLGINWAKIDELSFVYKIQKSVNSDKYSFAGHLNISYNNLKYVIFGIEGFELSSGYKLTNIKTILKGNIIRYVESDLLDH